jgi:hypothetical protein
MRTHWIDANGIKICNGDVIAHVDNPLTTIQVVTDQEGRLYLGTFNIPFSEKYQFDKYWEIMKKSNNYYHDSFINEE